MACAAVYVTVPAIEWISGLVVIERHDAEGVRVVALRAGAIRKLRTVRVVGLMAVPTPLVRHPDVQRVRIIRSTMAVTAWRREMGPREDERLAGIVTRDVVRRGQPGLLRVAVAARGAAPSRHKGLVVVVEVA